MAEGHGEPPPSRPGGPPGAGTSARAQLGTPDPGEFRSAMRRMVSAVTVVTTRHHGRPWGMTVNAFSSVCADPPTVLVCVNNRTATAADITRDHRFAVNLLSQDQLYLSRRCARPGQAKYLDDHALWPPNPDDQVSMPVLRDSLATFDCAVSAAHPVGTHLVVIGTVGAITTPPTRPPLLYGQGRYLHGVAISEAPAMLGALAWA